MHRIVTGATLLLALTILAGGCSNEPDSPRAPSAASPSPAVATPSDTATQAVSELDRILEAGEIRVGTTGDYPPFTYQRPGARGFEGLDIDMARSLASALGVELVLVKTSWDTLEDDLAAGEFDIAMGGVSVTLERAMNAYYSDPYLRDGKTPITRCENQQRFQTLAQIDRRTVEVVVNPGGTNEDFARAQLDRAQITVWPDNRTIFKQILAGKVDLMITDAAETRYQQQLHPQLCAVHPSRPFNFSEKAYLLPRDEALQQWVNQWLHQALENGDFDRIERKWLG